MTTTETTINLAIAMIAITVGVVVLVAFVAMICNYFWPWTGE